MDTAKLEEVLQNLLDRTKLANQVGPELEEFSSEELLDWPVSMQTKLADAMGVEINDVDVQAEPEVKKMQDFLTAKASDGDQLTNNSMEEFLEA